VGNRTQLDHVQVRHTSDDCFEFFGGTVDGKYLVCQHAGDDGFDWDLGYSGRLQFLIYQAALNTGDDSNGLEGDNDPNGSSNTPASNPRIWNATLCGPFKSTSKRQGKPRFGALLRRGTHGVIANTIFTGFDAGVEVRDSQTHVVIRSSNFFGNLTPLETLGEPQRVSLNDDRVNPLALLLEESRKNFSRSAGLTSCDDLHAPDLMPDRSEVDQAESPPRDDFFDPSARFVGALGDSSRTWVSEPWIRWD
jgi:hypothetical protein